MFFSKKIKVSRVWNIAYPIIIGNLAQNLLIFADTAFLGRIDEIALGASALGGIFYLAAIMLGMGFSIGVQVIIARRYGEEQYQDIGRVLQHALLFVVPFALLLFLLLRHSGHDILAFLIKSPKVSEATNLFFNDRIWGILFAFVNYICQAFFIGIARTKIISMVTCIIVAVNVLLDWLMIFGHWGFEAMGIRGAAIASVAAEGVATLIYLAYIYRNKKFGIYRIFKKVSYSASLMLQIIKISMPASIQNFISVASWFTFFIMIEKIGEQELAISNIGRSLYAIFLLPVWGFASAVNSLVSYSIGCRKPLLIFPILRTVIILTIICVLALELISFVFSGFIISIYTNIPELNEATFGIMPTICISALFFAVGFICFNTVSGTGNTHISLIIEIFTTLCYVAVVVLAVDFWHWGIVYVWLADGIYGIFMMIAAMIYLLSGKWIGKKV